MKACHSVESALITIRELCPTGSDQGCICLIIATDGWQGNQ